ncbi:sarcosine oxidase gamma subunit [Ameyamaea chiangmaiensis NBRC 103196]|uniref:Sarcosine oxidase gamma subunit n=1 Tax=Ameyamaea chiangmaiensis TaxID=442969 RepID=A0A850PC87_9PROT|nr:sarcosine oxidase subunit gamma family protein [Ameyamaea chiangmaiensis]MBS4075592.1 sarcosine oxidase gamma subunit [Ameyamaea chiangmaiensis]NVN40279.1 sarcosine oxidase gamma subunit [Ameyamaea chiangmaiensis]GBQ70841.1 sarcosine oxidase gamma subunit [Ameyamaea chiangmaiensis NBRC 103196]
MVEIAEGCVLTSVPATTRLVLQGRPAALAAAATALGLAAAPPMLRAATGPGGVALRMGPFELTVLPGGAGREALEAALAGLPHSLVDVSDRNVAFTLEGAHAADVLAALCPLDFALAAFPVGMATRTVLDKAGALIWRTAPQTFHIEVWRSFLPYLKDQIHEVARGMTFDLLAVQ